MEVETRTVSVHVNGVLHVVEVEVRTLLSDLLREHLGLTGTHLGCEHGYCGTCTVLVDGRAARSCLMLAPQVDGREVTTVELLGGSDALDPLQESFRRCHALQCGFCTPGILMGVLGEAKAGTPLEDLIDSVLPGHLCRCTGYVNIRRAIRDAWPHLEAMT
jgi:aerobic-type carbon monoxide dehydrogenase small subunit (CoxS/CutS family)